jgi:D-alanyl-D-alanine carboxypeptidase/D-alanyl-D-alanine-endopeptidase (penicillin-binding protein 4)
LRPDNFPPQPREAYEIMIDEARLDGKTAFCVIDRATGEVLEEHNAVHGLPPASVVKALTSLYAMDVLGPEYRFETQILGTGFLVDGVLQGDLILAGGGDPELTTDDLGALTEKLMGYGVTAITGNFCVWGGALRGQRQIDDGQPVHVAYNPPISGVMLNRNRVRFEWKRKSGGYDMTLDARSGNYSADVATAQIVAAAEATSVYTYEERGGIDHWTVAQAALGKGGARWLPTRQPLAYAGEVFRSVAAQNGLALPEAKVIESLPTETFRMASVESDPLPKILSEMLRYSYNLTAEAVGLAASQKRLGRVVGLRESAREMNRWAREKFGVSGIAQTDHSGLGDRSRIKARDLARLLADPWSHATLQPLIRNKAIKTKSGVVQRWVKTGTLHYGSGLAGYLGTPKGRELSFAIFSVDFDRRKRADLKGSQRPPGAQSWAQRARYLQNRLIERWAGM